jgi:hypothetical protein
LYAYEVKIGDLYYNLDDELETAWICNENNTDANYSYLKDTLNVPSVVFYDYVYYTVKEIRIDNCMAIKHVKLPSSITGISFRNCKKLKSVELSDSISTLAIFDEGFKGCDSITKISSPSKKEVTVGKDAFSGCTSLENLENLCVISDNYSFYKCTGLKEIETYNPGYSSFKNCSGLERVIIGGTKIAGNTFENCENLAEVYIKPGPVNNGYHCTSMYIGHKSFKGCNNISKIVCDRTYPPELYTNEWDWFPFEGTVAKNTMIYVPDKNSVERYRENGHLTGWSRMRNIDYLRRVEEIQLDETSVIIPENACFKLNAKLTPQKPWKRDLVWFSSDESVAIVDQTGLITAVSQGYAKITAKATDNIIPGYDDCVFSTCNVQVTKPVSSIILNKTYVDLELYEAVDLEATVLPQQANNKVLEWVSSDESVARVYELNNKGHVFARSKGSCIVTAKATDGSGVEESCLIIVGEYSSIDEFKVGSDEIVKIFTASGLLLFEGRYCDASLKNGIFIIVTEEGKYKLLIN